MGWIIVVELLCSGVRRKKKKQVFISSCKTCVWSVLSTLDRRARVCTAHSYFSAKLSSLELKN